MILYFLFIFCNHCGLAGTKKKNKDEGKPFIFRVGKGLVIRGVSVAVVAALLECQCSYYSVSCWLLGTFRFKCNKDQDRHM